ncbi:hypothetical protein RI129_009998 [Pyrocoelia pectoralis]|uniref:G-protein coupled receptors family 1 profile domain-containing protein n=1 Tax=Pyrocoelia pectoralis TaxID=417401 RepID=A0AAN7ZJ17_9COLE
METDMLHSLLYYNCFEMYVVKAMEFYPETEFYYLYFHERIIFFVIYLLIYIVAFIGNISVIITTIRRNQRHFQKCCLMSLSFSDLITATSNVVIHLSTFLDKLKVWKLGSNMCSFLPLLPIFGIIVSSGALVGIAFDRYQNVVHALKTRWQPSLRLCLAFFSIFWICSAGVSYPMYNIFKLEPVNVIFFNNVTQKPLYYDKRYLCVSFEKHKMMVYYISLMCIVFLPMLFIYLWLYIKIAQLIWKHRRPIHHNVDRTSYNSSRQEVEKTRVERKIRTFKIIVFLMCIFVVLRLPILVFDTVKLSINLNGHGAWVIKYVCSALTLLSCALNPFMYTFLNNTLRILKKSKNCLYHVCCFCLYTSEFDELQNNNPFIYNVYKSQSSKSSSTTHKTKSKNSVTTRSPNEGSTFDRARF